MPTFYTRVIRICRTCKVSDPSLPLLAHIRSYVFFKRLWINKKIDKANGSTSRENIFSMRGITHTLEWGQETLPFLPKPSWGRGLQESHSVGLTHIYWNVGNVVPNTSFILYPYLQGSRRERWNWTHKLILFDLISSLTICQLFSIWNCCKMWNHPGRMHPSGLVDTWETFLHHTQSWIFLPNPRPPFYTLLSLCSHPGLSPLRLRHSTDEVVTVWSDFVGPILCTMTLPRSAQTVEVFKIISHLTGYIPVNLRTFWNYNSFSGLSVYLSILFPLSAPKCTSLYKVFEFCLWYLPSFNPSSL